MATKEAFKTANSNLALLKKVSILLIQCIFWIFVKVFIVKQSGIILHEWHSVVMIFYVYPWLLHAGAFSVWLMLLYEANNGMFNVVYLYVGARLFGESHGLPLSHWCTSKGGLDCLCTHNCNMSCDVICYHVALWYKCHL